MQFSTPAVIVFGKSLTYLRICPFFTAFTTAFSSMRISLAKFIRITPCFISSIAASSIIPFVASISGTWIVMISQFSYISFTLITCLTARLRFQAPSTDIYGSYPYTSIPRLTAAFATFTPIAPSPITPNLLPSISVPANFFLAFSALFAIFSSSAFSLTHLAPPMISRDA